MKPKFPVPVHHDIDKWRKKDQSREDKKENGKAKEEDSVYIILYVWKMEADGSDPSKDKNSKRNDDSSGKMETGR